MKSWSELIKPSIVDWLLDFSDLGVRTLTLKLLFDLDHDHPLVSAAQSSFMHSRPIERLIESLQRLTEGSIELNWYKPKYRSGLWSMLLLSQLPVDPEDPRIRKISSYPIHFQRSNGAFVDAQAATSLEVDSWSSAASCLTGNVVAALIRLNKGRSEFVQQAFFRLLELQETDGGWLCRSWRTHARDNHSCFQGTICALDALAEAQVLQLSSNVTTTIQRACEFLLQHRLFRADHHQFKVIKERWLKLQFPYLVDYDILRAARTILRLNMADERIEDAINLIVSKQQEDGSWLLERTPSALRINLGKRNQANKWVTLLALHTLRLYIKGTVLTHASVTF
ncbi:MAG: hypothetical protein ACFFCQ_07365 [Promethearchaeota archaeon]